MKPVARPYSENDVPDLIEMMRDLARFEEYIDDFKVTEAFLRGEVSKTETAFFGIIVVEQGSELLGYASYFPIHFTYSLKPTYVLKELYVKTFQRSNKIGQSLFEKFREIAQQKNAAKIIWSVMPSNAEAKRFYTRMGGEHDTSWENWSLVF